MYRTRKCRSQRPLNDIEERKSGVGLPTPDSFLRRGSRRTDEYLDHDPIRLDRIMGTIALPWRYDEPSAVATNFAGVTTNSRRPYAARLAARRIDAFLGGGSSRSAGTRKRARNL
jgi:hypothetical protein